MSFREGVSGIPENVVAHPTKGLVAATTTKERKRHILTLAWPEESGQWAGIGGGGIPVTLVPGGPAPPPSRLPCRKFITLLTEGRPFSSLQGHVERRLDQAFGIYGRHMVAYAESGLTRRP
jgi:hypothetical protein